jgi:Transcriptional repressor TCF25
LDVPNWSFSYALALFRIHEKDPSNEDTKNKANKAIQTALLRFPTVIGQILSKNEVNTNVRSFQIDWPSVLDFVKKLCSEFQKISSENAVNARTLRAYESIVMIFVQQSFILWSSPAVLKWIYDNLHLMKESNNSEFQMTPIAPAILRYVHCDPRDFTDKFQTMPADTNPLDPSVVALSLTIDTNRPRLLQRGPRGT